MGAILQDEKANSALMVYVYRVDEYPCTRPSWQSPAIPLSLMDTGTKAEAVYLQQMDAEGWELVSVVNTEWEQVLGQGGTHVLSRAFYWKRPAADSANEEPAVYALCPVWQQASQVLPADGAWCWVWHTAWARDMTPNLVVYREDEEGEGWWWMQEGSYIRTDQLTHWMPAQVPKPPSGEG